MYTGIDYEEIGHFHCLLISDSPRTPLSWTSTIAQDIPDGKVMRLNRDAGTTVFLDNYTVVGICSIASCTLNYLVGGDTHEKKSIDFLRSQSVLEVGVAKGVYPWLANDDISSLPKVHSQDSGLTHIQFQIIHNLPPHLP